MFNWQNTSAYQAAAASGATTQAGLMQLVYSYLAQDLLRAAKAVEQKNIEARCAASNHALLLLGHLESWLENLEDPTLAESLRRFYRMLRSSILHLQAVPNPAKFEESAQFVLDARAAWQAKEVASCPPSRGPVNLPCQVAGSISFHA